MNDKVCFVCGNLYPNNVGGAEIFNYYLINELSKSFKLSIISTFYNPKIYNAQYIKFSQIKPVAIFFTFGIFFHFLFKKSSDTTIVLTYSRSHWINWWPYPLLKRMKKLNYIIIIHGGGLSKWGFKFPHKQLFLSAKEIIGISERICDAYKKRTGRTIKFLKPLIPFEKSIMDKIEIKQIFNIGANKKIFLYVGSLKQLKNPDVLLDAVITLKKKNELHSDFQFLFVGNGPLMNSLNEQCDKWNLKDQVTFLGLVDRDKIPLLYKISDYYIILSDFEGTPLSLLEAMFNELLVIGSNSPGINNIIQHGKNGLLFENRNSHMLAEILYNIETNDASTLRTSAVKTVMKDYNYKNLISEYEKLLSL